MKSKHSTVQPEVIWTSIIWISQWILWISLDFPLWTEFVLLQSTNLYAFCGITNSVHLKELWLADLLHCWEKLHDFTLSLKFCFGSLIFIFFQLSVLLTILAMQPSTHEISLKINNSFSFFYFSIFFTIRLKLYSRSDVQKHIFL